MTSSAAQGFDAVQDELFALISGDPELRTALTAIAESIESGEASASERRLSDWVNWLDEEGYSATTVQDHSKRFGSLLHDAGLSHRISGDTKTSDFVQELGQVPHLLELLFTLVDHSLTLHSDVVGAAGGTGLARGKVVAQRLGIDRKKLAIREGAGEAREASSEFDSTARDGQSQGGLNDQGLEPRRDEFGGKAQDVADRISTAREGRYVTREDGLNDRGLEPRRDYETQGEADRISTAREGRYVTREDGLNDRGLEPRRDYETQGESDRISTAREGRYMRQERRSEEERISADVRDALRDRRDDNLMMNSNGGGVESPEAKAYDDVREVVREEREPIMGGKGGVERPEARRYDDVREERIERREDMVAKDVARELEMPGRNGGGEEGPKTKAYDDVREERKDEREDIAKEEVELSDVAEVGVEREAMREKREVEVTDALGRTAYDAREVMQTREDMNAVLYDGTNGAGSEPRSDVGPSGGEKDAKAEMRETGPDMLGATV